jgi:hypothetical protein
MSLIRSAAIGVFMSVLAGGAASAAECCKDGKMACCEKKDDKGKPMACCDKHKPDAPKPDAPKPAPGHDHRH